MQIRYNVWYACHLNNSDISEDNIDMNNEYIKVLQRLVYFYVKYLIGIQMDLCSKSFDFISAH